MEPMPAGLVTRSMRTEQRGEQRVHVLTAVREYRAPAEDVWQALTDPERLPRWFAPVSGDLRPGGRFQFEGQAGGLVEACDPPRELRVTWEYGGELSWVVVRLQGDADATSLTLEHTLPVDPQRWTEFGPGAVGVGWDLSLLGLGLHLEGGEGVTPEEAEAWLTSDEGSAAVTESSRAWAEASVADGTEPDQASAAAARTTAFYTGRPVADASSAPATDPPREA
jgi:uncharacterized protein YndB with AHSA1/START domain